MDDLEFRAWHRLAHTPGLSRAAARKLLGACGSAQAVARLGADEVLALAGARAAAAWPGQPAARGEAGLLAACRWREGPGRHVLALGEPDYPELLLHAPDPPLLLYVQGDATLLHGSAADSACLAVVGSRQPTPAGQAHARDFARAFAQAGLTVVSGLAIGVDAAAHEGALDGGGPTVAVTGTGPDIVYPTRHRELAARIAAHGAIVTEYPPGTPSRAEHFPQRNRIIAGLARGTLVVEAALQSGSLITARLAAESGREVFAIPGSIDSPQSRGCHALIRQGALLVEQAQEVLAEMGWEPAPPRSAAPGGTGLAAPAHAQGPEAAPPDARGPDTSATRALLQALGYEPVDLDTLALRTGLPGAELAARLLELELDGRVSRMPGGLFQRCGRA
jgi:DNA processing protein